MRMKPFGSTGITVSEYGIGTWAMGGGVYGVARDDESVRTIHRAEELGVNFLDTAPMYGIGDRRDGRSEEVVGRALKGRRDKWIVATKFGRHLNGSDQWWQMREDFSGAQAVRSVEESLARLGTDRIDVLFVHSPPANLFDAEDAFAAMVKLREQGKIRRRRLQLLGEDHRHAAAGGAVPAIGRGRGGAGEAQPAASGGRREPPAGDPRDAALRSWRARRWRRAS